MNLNPVYLTAFDIDDAWFQLLNTIVDKGYIYKVTKGSYEGQGRRLELDFASVHITNPKHQIIPIIPEGMNIPPPTDMKYVEGDYLLYLMTDQKTESEDYTYGQRMNNFNNINQIQEVIKMFKEKGEGTNQACIEIGMPSDIKLTDPPCCRLIDCRLRYGKLHFYIYFRSWDAWAGFPSNLGGMQLLKQYMAEQIGVEDGEMIVMSKGLHIYEYCWDYLEIRTGKKIKSLEII